VGGAGFRYVVRQWLVGIPFGVWFLQFGVSDFGGGVHRFGARG
jgi:hypothetical protein